MKINIKATNITLTPAISDYVNKKISALEKYFQQSPDAVAHVEVGRITRHHKTGEIFRAEVHVIGAGLDVYADSEQADLYAAIDLAKDELIRNTLQGKDKRATLARRGAEMVKNMMKGFRIFKKRP